jgi:hypothetical protein
MRYRYPAVVLAAVAVMLATSEASAQRGRFGFGAQRGPMSLVTLAANEAVQKDLGVAEVDARKLRELNDEYRRALGQQQQGSEIDFELLRELTEEERRAVMAEMAVQAEAVAAKVNAEFEAKLAAIISPEEIGRLKQIRLQSQGTEMLYDADVAKSLSLSEEQTAKLAEIRRESESRQVGGFGQGQARRGGQPNLGPEAFARMREQAAEREAKSLEVLTDEQKQKLEELKGYPFDVSQVRGFGRRNN